MSVDIERRGPVLVARMNREHKRNAIDREMSLGIEAALVELDDNPELRVGILTGTNTVFSAGTDLRNGDDAWTEAGGEYGVIRRRRRKPLIAAVEGPALGGGLEILLACDLVVASATASFGLPEALRGVVPTSGAMFRAPRALPRAVARRMMLTGRPIDADEAYRVGLVSEIAAPGGALDGALRLADEICRSAPTAVEQILATLGDLDAAADAQGWAETARAGAVIRASEDFQEGVRAFFERREPDWPGR